MAPLVLVATLLVAACSGDSSTGPSSTTGTYQLTTVQGKALPYRMYADTNYSLDVAQGSIALTPDGSFTATMRSEERVENHLSVYADTVTGTWTLAGTTISFKAADGTLQSGTRTGKSITLVDSSSVTPLTFVYTMQ